MSKIHLRKLTKEDLSFLLEVRNDDTTRVFLENNSVFTFEDCESWFNKLSYPWFVILNENDERVGYIRTAENDEVGCDIHPKFRKKGYARSAYKEYLKDKSYASLWVFEENFAKNLYEELGFVTNGEEKIVREKKYVRMIYGK
jgi:ribosomal protein S18 acetylase RimI-like enzyme